MTIDNEIPRHLFFKKELEAAAVEYARLRPHLFGFNKVIFVGSSQLRGARLISTEIWCSVPAHDRIKVVRKRGKLYATVLEPKVEASNGSSFSHFGVLSFLLILPIVAWYIGWKFGGEVWNGRVITILVLLFEATVLLSTKFLVHLGVAFYILALLFLFSGEITGFMSAL